MELNNIIPCKQTTKYLDLNLDTKLKWKETIKTQNIYCCLQVFHNWVLRNIVSAPWYVRNEDQEDYQESWGEVPQTSTRWWSASILRQARFSPNGSRKPNLLSLRNCAVIREKIRLGSFKQYMFSREYRNDSF